MIALTGGMGSGKSTIAEYLRKSGIKVLNLDEVGHEALEDDEVKGKLVKTFGSEIIDEGKVNRKKLGKIVFSDRKKLEMLNNMVHPKMLELLWKKIDECSEDIIAVDGAVIIDIGIQYRFDFIIVVDTDTQTQIERVMKRDNITKEEAVKRIKMQINRKERLKYADFVIDTSKDFEELKQDLKDLVNMIRKLAKEN